jgi:drug/metabolite transporter (DMT)-like permease
MENSSTNAVEQDSMKAIGMMSLAVFLLSAMDLALKQLVEHYPSMQVVFLRCVTSAPLLATLMLARNRKGFRVKYPADHLLRALIGLIMLYAVGECFRQLQLADAYAIFFAAPLLITLLSGPVLGEKAGSYRLAAAVVGFAGVLIVLQPGMNSQLISYGAVMGLLAVVAYAFMALLLRRMGHHDSTVAIAFWFIALVGVGAGLFSILSWKPIQWEHWPWLVLLGVTGTFGQLLLTGAFKRASVAVIAPLDYTHMIWAVIYGYLFWGHLPGLSTWAGTAVIVSSGLYIIFREHRVKRRLNQVNQGHSLL